MRQRLAKELAMEWVAPWGWALDLCDIVEWLYERGWEVQLLV